ncbi:hypothetical protein UFOVP1219_54 [uncultured Caudovirales phage]|uniref:Tail assembly chaperone n=1 Tax=uncultured Caudovirales phage TaxID=2100421 RepID=A0A6J5Q2V9_9CAUD|nr:hypothetical protein UFOVP476_26 [uncultured Caudovirales phage]CAB4176606.1 hypothetical protein UFOVP986_49 [uncultured Caudovirales phage]CAB4191480.1 hypothetical protein UFOVP1219_54 [uncultured Caudovirales phage]CAB4223236.1 hypothetical protein UFOVP1671_29 [uncultured Caudovirales phage]CAB5220484.1 hypothetical protein UFOVP358_4 [uncultured Caudovirales phage]
MSALSKKIRSAQDIDREVITIPEWDVSIEVHSMTVRQRAAFVSASQDLTDSNGERLESVYGQILLTCCLDPDTREPVFSADDLAWVMTEKSGSVVDNLVSRCLEVSGLKEKAVDEAGKSSSDSLIVTGELTTSDEVTSN